MTITFPFRILAQHGDITNILEGAALRDVVSHIEHYFQLFWYSHCILHMDHFT